METRLFDDLLPQQGDPFSDIGTEPGFTPGDYLKGLKRGIQQIPGSLTGLADVPGALLTGERYADQSADKLGDLTGFKPGQWAKETKLSPGGEAAMQELDTAWKKSGADRLGSALLGNRDDLPQAWRQADLSAAGKAIVDNPGAAAMNVVESIPGMLVGGGIGKGLAVAGKVAPVVAGAAGEGIITAGQQMDQTDRNVDPRTAAATALAAGAGTGLIAGVGGKVAQRLGLEDVQTSMAGGRADDVGRGMAGRVGGGAAAEAGQEFLQSGQEQAWQNVAEGNPLGEGVIRSSVEGAIAGAVMGGGANLLPERRQPQPVTVPRQDGQGEERIDPATGPLSAAAVDHVQRTQTSDDLFGDLTPAAPVASAIEPLVNVPETGDPFADLVPASPLQDFAAQVEPVSLDEAQALAAQADGAQIVAPHPAGDGYLLAPREWFQSEQIDVALQPGNQQVSIERPQATDPLAGRIQAVLDAYDTAGHPDNGKIIRAAMKSRAPTEQTVAFWEAQLDRNLRTWQSIAGQGQPVEAKLRTADDLWQGDREQATRTFVPDDITAAVLARSNALVQQLAERGVHLDEVDSRFPADVSDTKKAESGLRGLFLRYAKQLEAKAKGYKRFDAEALAKTEAELFQAIGYQPTIDQAAGTANTAPSEAQIAAGNYQKGHVKVGTLDIAIENPVGSTRTGPGWQTTMQAHYGYLKRTKGADGDQVDVYVKQGTPTDHTGPVFVIDQFDPATGKFDEHKAMVGYRFQGAAIKAYDQHFSDGSGPSRRRTVTKMTAEQFKDWAQNGDTRAPAGTPKGWEGFQAGDRVTTKAGTTGTLSFDETGTIARVTPDVLDAGSQNTAGRGVFSVTPGEVSKASASQPAPIEDFGEKIGGARKDLAQPTGPKAKVAPTPAETEPGWQRRFKPLQNMLRSDETWNLIDTKTGKPVRGAEFKSEQAAQDAIPLIAVAQKHRVVAVKDGFEIMRDVTDRKRVKVVDQVFPTRDAAMTYMSQHAQAIIETKTSFREELFARPEKVMRDGQPRRTGHATAEDFAKTFGFRGVEFGLWNNQDERQEVMNHAYDGLLDLAEVLGVPPKALSLNGDLALAFGARGQGLSGAIAHYERGHAVINLTKMQGAGALAHEWFHAADHYFGRQDGKASSEKIQNKRGDTVFDSDGTGDYASHGLSLKSKMREELQAKYKSLIQTLFTKAEQYVEDTEKAERFVGSTRDTLVKSLTAMRKQLETAPEWQKRNNKPASAEQLAEFDRLADDLVAGRAFQLETRSSEPKKGQRFGNIRLSNDQLDALSALFKAVRGRNGMNAEGTGIVDGIRSDLRRYAERVRMLEEARNGNEKTKRVPTEFAMNAKRIDQGSATDYWTTAHEMAARAFSAYVEDKLPGRSDFLSYGSNNAMPEYRLFNVRPFPEGAERVAIGKAFDDFIGALQIRETEKGIELYNQAASSNTSDFDQYLFTVAEAPWGDVRTILSSIAQGSASTFNRELAKLLMAQNLATTIQTADFDGQHSGGYNPQTDVITIMQAADAEQTILHELMHASTVRALSNKSVAAGAMRALLKEVRQHLGLDSHYGLTDVREFVADAFSNHEFQEALRQIPVKASGIRGKIADAWGRFVSTVRQLLGLDRDQETALGKALELGARLMQENQTAPLRGYMGEIIGNQAKTDDDRLTVRDWLTHQLANQRSWALGALTRDQLADIYGREMPEVAEFDRVVQQMDQARNIVAEQADALIERWRKLPSKMADALADVMHLATLEQFDPDTKTREEVQTPEQSILVKEWGNLSPEAQQIYRDVRDQYQATLVKLRNGLAKRADTQTAAAIRLEFDKYLAEGPYFPLARFGDFILIANNRIGERIVEAFESSAAREKRARGLRAQGWTTKLTAKKAYSAASDGPSGEFVGKVLGLVGGLDIEAKEKAALMDSLNQLAIGALPDQSYRKHFSHRKGTPGFSQDAMRAFASSMQHVAHHVARVLHGDELQILVDGLNKRTRETIGDVDTTAMQQVANELSKRLDLMLNPTTHPVTAALGQVGFVMSLGGSVASGITNLSQTPLVTFPWLGSRFGFTKAAAALTAASKDYFAGRWDKWSGFVMRDGTNLSADERRALTELEDAGLINLTQAHDLAGTANTDSASSRRSFAINRAMKLVGWTFHVPEVMNRQVSALAAYRLAREKGQDHTGAVETARETLRRTHFDYSASNRARWMAGNFTRVITMFKQYSQNVTYLLWRQTYQALKGETPEVRQEARRMLLGVAATHFAAAGALGLPLGVFGVTPLLGLLAMGMGSEDEPWDWQVEFRNLLADLFGKQAGEAIAHGPLRTLTGIDMAARVGLGDLWVRAPQAEKEGRDLVEAWMLTLLGPVAGYAGNIGTAVKAFDEGKVGRGLEAMLPKFIAAPIKASRYEAEGVKSWRGDDLGVKLDGDDIFATALGFQPSQLAEMFEGQRAIKGREAKLMDRREEISNMFTSAALAGDTAMQAEAIKAAQAFSLRNPSMALTADSLRRSLLAKVRNQALIQDGVYLSKKRQDLRAEGRFANVE